MSKQMILYYAPMALSLAPHIALLETGAEFELRRINLREGSQNSRDFLKISPLGRVPALVTDGESITEAPALLAYIASLEPKARLVPAEGTAAFARCFQWLFFLSSSLHGAYAQFQWPGRLVPEAFACRDELSEHGRLNTIRLYREVERRLGPKWAAGEAYSIADICLFPFYTWAARLQFEISRECPKWTTQFRRMLARPAVQRALGREGV